jgi:hypothetical protein
MPLRTRPLALLAVSIALPLAITLTCATAPPNPNAAKYPPRPNGCKIRVFHTAAPEVKEWDDLGVAHVDCYLDVGAVQCLKKLRMEACRMGGDIIYDVPKKPLRPTDQGMVYTGHVAHTKLQSQDGGKENEDDPGEPGQPESESTGPVQPIEPIAPLAPSAVSPADAGRPLDARGK